MTWILYVCATLLVSNVYVPTISPVGVYPNEAVCAAAKRGADEIEYNAARCTEASVKYIDKALRECADEWRDIDREHT